MGAGGRVMTRRATQSVQSQGGGRNRRLKYARTYARTYEYAENYIGRCPCHSFICMQERLEGSEPMCWDCFIGCSGPTCLLTQARRPQQTASCPVHGPLSLTATTCGCTLPACGLSSLHGRRSACS